jgi:prepilin-type N-terminal cleavage/methylation domain-containing protein
MHNNKKKQSGFTLLELMLVLGLIAVGVMLEFESKQVEMQQMQARVAGGLLFEYNNAVRSWISSNPDANAATNVGSGWLKPTSCGGTSSVQYLRCSFPDSSTASPIPQGRLALQSITAITGTAPNKRVTVTTTTSPFLNTENVVRSDLSGLAAIVAAAGATSSSSPAMMATDGQVKSSPLTGAITMVASNNAANDVWLRTDGSNTMNSNLTFNASKAANLREIHNISRLYSLAGEIFYLGQSGGALANQLMVVDANPQILGNLLVSNAAGQANALTLTKGNLAVQNGSLSVQNGTVAATGTISSSTAMTAPIFYDSNNSAFRVDPTSTSVLQDLQVNNSVTTGGRVTVGEYVGLNAIANEGWGCSPNGLVGRNTQGAILSCTSGIWAASASQDGGAFYLGLSTFNGYARCFLGDCMPNPRTGDYNCPAGFTPVGGLMGQAWRNREWDETIYYWNCVKNP